MRPCRSRVSVLSSCSWGYLAAAAAAIGSLPSHPTALSSDSTWRRCCPATAFLAANVGEGLSTLDTLQDANDLRFTEATLAHVICPLPPGGILSHPVEQLAGFRSGEPLRVFAYLGVLRVFGATLRSGITDMWIPLVELSHTPTHQLGGWSVPHKSDR